MVIHTFWRIQHVLKVSGDGCRGGGQIDFFANFYTFLISFLVKNVQNSCNFLKCHKFLAWNVEICMFWRSLSIFYYESNNIMTPHSLKNTKRIDFTCRHFSPKSSVYNLNVPAWRTLLKIPVLFEKKVKNEKCLSNFLEILLSYPGVFFGPPGTI